MVYDVKRYILPKPENEKERALYLLLDQVITDLRNFGTLAATLNASGEVSAGHGYIAPVGGVIAWPAAAAPSGWLLANGAAVSRTTYADLFGIIGTTYGVGDGSTTFNVPDVKGRVIVGKSTDTEFDVLGEAGGEKTHALSEGELAAHTHTINHDHGSTGNESAGHAHAINMPDIEPNTHAYNSSSAYGNISDNVNANVSSHNTGSESLPHTHVVAAHSGNSGPAGSGTGHNNLQPYITMNWIIKY